ncbi:MAG TPA: PAS-domain containing protein [Stellaceae bacterium]|nr:PAS-domain containing protein [Stellaceae bacterium]
MPKSGRSPADTPPAAPGEDERLRDFAEIGSDWFWEKDAELRFTYMSSGIDGQAAPFACEFIGKRIDEVSLPGFEGVDWRPLLQAFELRKPFREFRFTRRTQNGGLRHLAVSGMPIFDAAGRFLGYRGTGRDLTKETLAEERAAAAQSRLIDAIEAIPEGFMLLDKEDRLVLCNSRFRELHKPIAAVLVPGTGFAELCRASCYAEQPDNARGREEEWIADRLRRHQAPHYGVEERQVGERWFQISEQRTRDGGCVVVQTEITAVKRREQELAEKTALLRATLEHMAQGLLVLDAQLRIKMWNDRWIELVEIPPELVGVGLPMEPIMRLAALRGEFGPGEIDGLVRVRLQRLRDSDSEVAEFHPPNGRVIEARRSAMPDGGTLFTFADITERKRVEADLRRAKDEAELASRSKTEFLANMSHELRTPLNAIIGFSDILMGQIFGPLGDARYSDYARDIRDSGLHLLNLINDVLDVSKVEFGKVELIEETVDIVAVVESCARLMRDRADTAGLRLVQELPPGLPYLQGDSRRLKQVLLNLLSNAVKFTPSGGRVTIKASYRPEDGFRLVVEDTGIGIAKGDLEKALRPFGQIDSRLARKYQGTGLGLPLARSMAELHGGKLELDSAPGQGTTATIWLPPARVLQPANLPRAAQG